jgi:hypothetical protein
MSEVQHARHQIALEPRSALRLARVHEKNLCHMLIVSELDEAFGDVLVV